ncbi:circadian clock-controlled protein daywake-like [Nymphalis io]|uniref:circadian clock-controlled protein daywake-like n=1 Tax=Inachis io TaxID=171585 RepID=UPI002167622D|nr:circadian clock-controlled protein daywake-like [Nymphalis io]
MFLSVLITFVCFVSGVLTNSLITPCKISDIACVDKSVKGVIPKVIAGIPGLGVESSDPIFVEEIDGNLSIIKYKFFNTTITGFKNCEISNFKLNEDITTIHYDLICPKIHMKGKYEVSGRLVVLPVEGNGDFELITGKYSIHVDSELKKVQGNNGKTHLFIKNFKLKSKALSPIKYDFKNLFNGQKDLSDAVHKFAHENWFEVAELVQEPTWNTCMKKVTSNVNKYLKSVAVEDIILN